MPDYSPIFNVLLALGILILAGAILALPILIPPIRRLAQRNTKARKILLGLLSVFSFLIIFLPFTRAEAEAGYVFGLMVYQEGFPTGPSRFVPVSEEAERNKDTIITELWLRQMTPPPLRILCYSTQPVICRLADDAISRSGPWGWNIYLMITGIALIPMLTNSVLVWRFTRRKVIA